MSKACANGEFLTIRCILTAAFGDGVMIVAAFAQAGVAAPIVRDDQLPLLDGAPYKATKGFFATVGGDGEPDAPGIATVLARVLRGSRLTTALLHGASDESLVMHGAALAARAAADPCLIDLDVLTDATADAIPIRADHSGAKLVKKQY